MDRRRSLYIFSCLLAIGCSANASDEMPDSVHSAKPLNLADSRHMAVFRAVATLPQEQALGTLSAFAANPDRFFNLLDAAEVEAAQAGNLLELVDKHHGLDSSYAPIDLVSLKSTGLNVSRNDLQLRQAIMPAVLALDQAARAAGIVLVFSSAYRSYQYQKQLFDRYALQHGEIEASRFSARAGHSQHQLGTAVDFGSIDDSFAATPAGKWLQQNAWQYGFSMSYPQGMEHITGYIWESWHFRYITQAGTMLEREFFGSTQQYFLEFLKAYTRERVQPE